MGALDVLPDTLTGTLIVGDGRTWTYTSDGADWPASTRLRIVNAAGTETVLTPVIATTLATWTVTVAETAAMRGTKTSGSLSARITTGNGDALRPWAAGRISIVSAHVGTRAAQSLGTVVVGPEGPAGPTEWALITDKPTLGDAAAKNVGSGAGTVAAGDHGHASYVAGAASTVAQEVATVGAELITADGWTLGAGWAGDFASGFTHPAGNTAPLAWAPWSPTGTKTYMVEFTIDSATNSSDFTVTLGGSFGMVMYEGATGGTHRYSRGIQSTADGSLVFTPTNGLYDGTIRAVSVKEVTGSFEAPSTWKDSTAASALEIRSTAASSDNIFVGKEAGRFNTTGHENVILGHKSMRMSTSGFWNVALGHQTLEANVNGTRNVAIGVYCLQSNITGHRNIAIGPHTMKFNTHGIANVAIGVDCLWYNETGNYNLAMGQAALAESRTGDCNIAIGRAALAFANGQSDNIAIGDYALYNLTATSQPALAIGQDALRGLTIGAANLAIGDKAVVALTTGNDTVGVGANALGSVTTASGGTALGSWTARYISGERNTAIGAFALMGVAGSSTGIRNTAVGHNAGAGMTTGSRNVIVGASSGAALTTATDNILIGYNIQGTTPADSYVLNIGDLLRGNLSTKTLGIHTVTDPKARLHLPAGEAAANKAPLKINAGVVLTTPEAGAIEFDGTSLYFTTSGGVRKTLAVV